MTTDPRERLRRIDPAPVAADPPSGAIEAAAVIHEIERRMGMESRDIDQPTGDSGHPRQAGASPSTAPDRVLDAGQHRSRRPRRSRLAGVAAFVAVLFVGAAAFGLITVLGEDDTPAAGPSDDPAATIEAYYAAYNARDLDAVMAVFTEESVMIGHPAAAMATGLAAIKAVQVQDLSGAASEDAYTISNVQVTGNTVTWDQVWTSSGGDRYCHNGQHAVVEDGKILTWTWPDSRAACP